MQLTSVTARKQADGGDDRSAAVYAQLSYQGELRNACFSAPLDPVHPHGISLDTYVLA